MILTLPWPQRILSPNARAHYMAVGKAKKALRAEWAWQAKAQGAGEIAAKSLTVALEFHKPSRRAMDMDNMLASCKAGLDGLADVLGVDDSKWTLVLSVAPEIGGFVRVEVRNAEQK